MAKRQRGKVTAYVTVKFDADPNVDVQRLLDRFVREMGHSVTGCIGTEGSYRITTLKGQRGWEYPE